jgi:hypothetical protein
VTVNEAATITKNNKKDKINKGNNNFKKYKIKQA